MICLSCYRARLKNPTVRPCYSCIARQLHNPAIQALATIANELRLQKEEDAAKWKE